MPKFSKGADLNMDKRIEIGVILLVAGILLTVAGATIASTASHIIDEYETTTGQVIRFLDSGAREEYEEAKENYKQGIAMVWLGACGIVFGLVFLVLGIMNKEAQKKGVYSFPQQSLNYQQFPYQLPVGRPLPQQPSFQHPPQKFTFQQLHTQYSPTLPPSRQSVPPPLPPQQFTPPPPQQRSQPKNNPEVPEKLENKGQSEPDRVQRTN